MLEPRQSFFVVAFLPALLAGAAAAQDSGAKKPAQVTADAPENAQPRDLLKTAEAQLEEMKLVPNGIRALLDSARDDRDVIKVLCLSDKLDQAEVAIASATERLALLRVGVAQSDADRMKHEAAIIGVLKGRAVSLASEANQCVGEDMGFIGENDLKLTIDPGLPPEAPNEIYHVGPGVSPEDAGFFPPSDVVLLPPPLTSPTT